MLWKSTKQLLASAKKIGPPDRGAYQPQDWLNAVDSYQKFAKSFPDPAFSGHNPNWRKHHWMTSGQRFKVFWQTNFSCLTINEGWRMMKVRRSETLRYIVGDNVTPTLWCMERCLGVVHFKFCMCLKTSPPTFWEVCCYEFNLMDDLLERNAMKIHEDSWNQLTKYQQTTPNVSILSLMIFSHGNGSPARSCKGLRLSIWLWSDIATNGAALDSGSTSSWYQDKRVRLFNETLLFHGVWSPFRKYPPVKFILFPPNLSYVM